MNPYTCCFSVDPLLVPLLYELSTVLNCFYYDIDISLVRYCAIDFLLKSKYINDKNS